MALLIRVVVAFATVTFAATAAQGQTTWYVDVGNCAAPGTGSQADPFCAIKAGMDAAMNGDTVIVADGIYTGLGNKNLDFGGKAMTLRSANGAGSCIIDCEGDGRGFSFQSGETPATVLDGFTITGGYAHGGAGINCLNFSSPTIKNCVIRNNSTPPAGAPSGGGLYCANSSPALINCTITQNTSLLNGGGIYLHNANPRISNCTISGNTANRGGGIYAYYASNPTMTNSIMWKNTAPNGPEIYMRGSSVYGYPTLTVSYSDVEGGQEAASVFTGTKLIWGEGNIDADPAFAFADDAYLLPSSPCIDVGTNNPPGGLPQTDRDGNPRPLDGNGDGISLADMGAHEYNAQEPSIALSRHTAEFFATVGGANPDQQVLSIRNGGGGTLSWQSESGCAWLQPIPSTGNSTGEVVEVSLQVNIASLQHGKHTCPLMMFDEQAVNSPRWMEATLYLSSTLHVPAEFETIQAAIDAALPSNDIVLVADGIYTGPGNKNLDFGGKALTVRSENGPETCIIDCEGDGRGFYFHSRQGSESVVSGFTITNGLTQRGGGIYCDDASPTISNCRIVGNMAEYSGGGISCGYPSSPTIIDCTISANSSPRGGGIDFVGGNPTLTNCTISGNSSDWGGGIRCADSSPIITNCTITRNMASTGGGIYCNGFSTPTMVNSILWNNIATDGPEIALSWDPYRHYCPSLTASYCDVEGGQAAAYVEPSCTLNWIEGNIDVDPRFVDPSADYHLLAGSPCIDAGDNSVTTESTDLDGSPRIVDGDGDSTAIVDMGAYEFQGAGEPIPTVSEWGMVVMTLLLLMVGIIVLGRRCPTYGS